jgi:S1-C subfamily serine protease
VFTGFGPEEIIPVEVPDAGVLDRSMLEQVGRSIVKITGDAPACNRGQEGSGAVIAPGRIVTNAHVVAGVREPRVQVTGVGQALGANVVLFDPARDVAILSVPGLKAPALDLGESLSRGDSAVVAGFPRNGPYQAAAARVRGVVKAKGDDIYGRPGVEREVYSLYTQVEPGNSGGPLLDPDGDMVGLVFARSQNDARTGYALTLEEIDDDLQEGLFATRRVSTRSCSVG